MELNIEKSVCVIVSKDRKFIAKGNRRYRCLVRVDDDNDTIRILTYASTTSNMLFPELYPPNTSCCR